MKHQMHNGLCIKCGETDENASEFDFVRAWYDLLGSEPQTPDDIKKLVAERKLPDIKRSWAIAYRNTKWFLKSLVNGKVATGDNYETIIEVRAVGDTYQVIETHDAKLRPRHTIAERLLKWFAVGETGSSSMAIARAAAGHLLGPAKDGRTPSDVADFRRCVLLLREVPEARELGIRVLARSYPGWAALDEVWDEIEATLIEEAGDAELPLNRKRAPKAYALLRNALGGM